MLTYPEYFDEARRVYDKNLYQNGVYKISSDYSEEFMVAVESVAKHVGNFFDNNKPKRGDLATNFSDILSLKSLPVIVNEIVPSLERDLFRCYLFVDKVYCYRSHLAERRASWLWHWDNNPNEVIKIMVYLSDVDDEDDGPFEYMVSDEGIAPTITSSRTGHDNWESPRNKSRLLKDEMQALEREGYKPRKVMGPAGTTIVFNNNCAHRANPPAEGRFRDIITFRTRPTIEKVEHYIDERWTTNCDVTGAVPKNPAIKRQR